MDRIEFNQEFKTIVDGYNEKLLECHHTAFNNADKPTEYIINYFKFLRDYYLITTPDDDDSKETEEKVEALIAIVAEYDKYAMAREILNKKELTEDKLKKYQEEKDIHWKNFIQLLALNLGDGN